MILFLLSIFCCFISADFGAGITSGYCRATRSFYVSGDRVLTKDNKDSMVLIGGHAFYLKNYKSISIGADMTAGVLKNNISDEVSFTVVGYYFKKTETVIAKTDLKGYNPYVDLFFTIGTKYEQFSSAIGLGVLFTRFKPKGTLTFIPEPKTMKAIGDDNGYRTETRELNTLFLVKPALKMKLSYNFDSKIVIECSTVISSLKLKKVKINAGYRYFSFSPQLSHMQLSLCYKIN